MVGAVTLELEADDVGHVFVIIRDAKRGLDWSAPFARFSKDELCVLANIVRRDSLTELNVYWRKFA